MEAGSPGAFSSLACLLYALRMLFLLFFFWGQSDVPRRIGVILAFTLPRVPSYTLNDNTPLAPATGSFASSIPFEFSRFPANFSFPAYAEIQVNTQDNFLPLTFLHLRAQVFDLDSNRLVGSGDLGKRTIPAKSFPQIQLPLNFTYIASNDTDQTCMLTLLPEMACSFYV